MNHLILLTLANIPPEFVNEDQAVACHVSSDVRHFAAFHIKGAGILSELVSKRHPGKHLQAMIQPSQPARFNEDELYPSMEDLRTSQE